MGFLQDIDNAVGTAVCSFLNNGGNAALATAVVGGLAVPGGQVPALAAGLGLLALNRGCSFDPNGAGPPVPGNVTGCMEVSTGTLTLYRTVNGTESAWYSNVVRIDHCYRIGETSGGVPIWTWQFELQGGVLVSQPEGALAGWTAARGAANAGSTCSRTSTGAPPPDGTLPPVDVTTPQGCSLTVDFDSWLVEDDGEVRPVLKITSNGTASSARANDGVVGGCNFEPLIFIGGNGNGDDGPRAYPYDPTPTPPGDPPSWWIKWVSSNRSLTRKDVEDAVRDALQSNLAAEEYVLNGVCEINASGEPVDNSLKISIPAAPLGPGLVSRLDAIVDLLQHHKNLRQPTCYKKPGAGDSVTVNFKEDPSTQTTRNPLYKRLSYIDPSRRGDAYHQEHWRGFAWNTGPIVVTNHGTPMGTVQVWAESEAEGRRVIEHAAAAAGVDPYGRDARWSVSASSDPRYGRSARVLPCRWQASNELMVSSRNGPSGSPSWMRDP